MLELLHSGIFQMSLFIVGSVLYAVGIWYALKVSARKQENK